MYIALIMVSGSVKNPFSSDCINTGFFHKQHIHKQRPESELLLFEIIGILHSSYTLSSRNNGLYSKK